MVRLSEDDSVPRVEDAAERFKRLCAQCRNADKYQQSILPTYNDMMARKTTLDKARKESNAAQDTVWLYDSLLDDVLRDTQGRAKEFDRSNPGANTAGFIFPGGNITSIVTMPDKDEPEAAHAIAQKIVSLGNTHVLYPYAAQIESAVADCKDALAQQVAATRAEVDAKTALVISKVALVRQYNAIYYTAASDVDKNYAEKLFPKLDPPKKKKGGTASEDPAK